VVIELADQQRIANGIEDNGLKMSFGKLLKLEDQARILANCYHTYAVQPLPHPDCCTVICYSRSNSVEHIQTMYAKEATKNQ